MSYEDENYTCRCGREGEAPHQCPYAVELDGNYDPEYCTCCISCENNCVDDI